MKARCKAPCEQSGNDRTPKILSPSQYHPEMNRAQHIRARVIVGQAPPGVFTGLQRRPEVQVHHQEVCSLLQQNHGRRRRWGGAHRLAAPQGRPESPKGGCRVRGVTLHSQPGLRACVFRHQSGSLSRGSGISRVGLGEEGQSSYACPQPFPRPSPGEGKVSGHV